MHDWITRLPKIDIHLHLDGAVRPETILDLARAQGITLPADDLEGIRNHVQVSPDCRSLMDFLDTFDVFMPVLSTEDAMARVAYELCEDLAKDNVIYFETRFAPLLQEEQGLSIRAAVEAVLDGIKRGKNDFGIDGQVLLCGLRNRDPSTTLAAVELAHLLRDNGVCGVDLAGDESKSSAPHAAAFKKAQDYGLNITIHAGEAGPAANIREAIDNLGAIRIGHGVNLRDDPELLDLLVQSGIPLEMCPTSNLQTMAVDGLENHPAKFYLDKGIRVTINTDDPQISGGISLSGEYELCHASMGLTREDIETVLRTAAQVAFLPENEKKTLTDRIDEGIKASY